VARDQWETLATTLRSAGADIEILEPQPELPDLVFTANAGTVNGSHFVPARFRHPERRAEVPHYVEWFEEHGYGVAALPEGPSHEGAGDALPFGNVFLSGYRTRSDAGAHGELSRLLGVEVLPVELVDPRFYHFDLTFCPLDERRAIVVPDAWDSYGRRVIESLVPEPLALDLEEAAGFTANSVVVGATIVMPGCPARVGRQLEAWGFEVVESPVGEFLKAGGGCRCLTLALDIDVAMP
jgi:ornithine--oxo-acid transaminase